MAPTFTGCDVNALKRADRSTVLEFGKIYRLSHVLTCKTM